MKLAGEHRMAAPRGRVFAALLDAAALQRSLPGCERLEKTGENSYSATLSAGVGSIKGVFTGSVRLQDVQPPQSFRMAVDGKGGAGFVKGSGELQLDDQGDATLVRYVADVQVGGMLAAVGQRMIEGAARMMASRFFAAIEAEARRE